MKYIQKLILRLLIAVFFIFFGLKIIYYIISPITFYLCYLTMFFYSPAIVPPVSFIINNYKLNFIPACTAGSAYLLLILLTVLTDLKLKKAVKIIAFGSLAILIANVIRIDFLVYILITKGADLFHTLHLFIWDILSTIFVALLWILLTLIFKIKEIPVYSDFKKLKDSFNQ